MEVLTLAMFLLATKVFKALRMETVKGVLIRLHMVVFRVMQARTGRIMVVRSSAETDS